MWMSVIGCCDVIKPKQYAQPSVRHEQTASLLARSKDEQSSQLRSGYESLSLEYA